MARYSVIPILLALGVMTGCAGPGADLVVIPASDGATSFDSMDRAMLQLRVKNQGATPAPHSPVTVEFRLSTCTVTAPFQDGGTLAAGQSSSVLKFEVPQDCMESGCEFQIKLDPHRKVSDSNRANNSIQGKFVRETAKK